ncbi:hypothetical protein ARMSODRAFT_989317 [Armillaria solidipes]|uniref:Uncharacterized protein n=1 Tax=Armillaria solidipes TaxID=1076256 RepID=A0A2H3BKR6_9AGAR|nr:hypothetical protein ARMSODRAFT_989317 [Armillaria solidipes]
MLSYNQPANTSTREVRSAVFPTWAPDLFHYYAMYLRDLLMHDISLVMNWTSCIFAAATFNFANLPFGWCAITALGRFDPRFGGHLVLWDLKLVLDFSPGSTILIPSAILRHSNTTIGRSKRRYSFTQYTYWASLDADGLVKARKTQEERWKLGLSMFTKLEDLKSL